jgi:hypothetical protein
LRARIAIFVARKALSSGFRFVPAPVPAGKEWCLYPRPSGLIPAGTRVFCARCHLYSQAGPTTTEGTSGTLKCFSRDYTGPRRDVGPAGAVFPVAISPVRPSPSLQRHAGYCDAIPDAVGVHGGRTSPCLPLHLVRAPVNGPLEPACGRRPDSQPLHHRPRGRSCTSTRRATMPRRTRFARTVVNSAALLAMPQHVGE